MIGMSGLLGGLGAISSHQHDPLSIANQQGANMSIPQLDHSDLFKRALQGERKLRDGEWNTRQCAKTTKKPTAQEMLQQEIDKWLSGVFE